MIDTHCHLLPRLDDGPRDEEEAVALAAQLAADGVETVVCTPHLSRRYPTAHATAAERLEQLRAALADAGIQLSLELGAELSPTFAMSEPAAELKQRALGRRFCLVELLADTPEVFFGAVVERLAPWSLVPVFAHPERNAVVQRRPGALDAARRDGALLQIVAPSLTGRWGPAAERAAWKLLESGRGDLLASDAHRSSAGRSRLAEATTHIEQRLGGDLVERLTRTTPAALLAG